MVSNKEYDVGQLVRVQVHAQDTGFATCFRKNENYVFYKRVDLTTYPSCNDFFGETTIINNDDRATIVSKLGWPVRLACHKDRYSYNVYEVLVNGVICQAFQRDLD